MAVSIALKISLTAIAAVFHVSPDGSKIIVLGADGVDTITLGDDKERAVTGRGTNCKIASTDGFYYAMAGLSAGGPDSGYNAYKEMERALTTQGDFKARITNLEAEILTTLNRLNAPSSDRRVEMLIIDSSTFLRYYLGVIDRDQNGQWSFRSSSGIRQGSPTTDEFVGIGIGTRAAELQPRLMMDQANTIREMLRQEAVDRPGEVGEPFSIVRIANGQAQWLEQGACGLNKKPVNDLQPKK